MSACGRGLGPVQARVSNSRLRVGVFAPSGTAITLIQGDSTTCGATVVLAARLLLGAAGDFSADGGAGDSGVDGDSGSAASAASTALPGLRLKRALHAEQRRLQARMNRRSGGPLGPLPWTRRLGSTPWAIARAMTQEMQQLARAGSARCTGAAAPDYWVHWVPWAGEGGARWPSDVERVRRALEAGLPVVVLAGGPLAVPYTDGSRPLRMLRSAVRAVRAVSAVAARVPIPRHYVLALPWRLIGADDPGPGRVHLYEPSSGAVRVLDLLSLRASAGPGPRELGYWPRILAVILPRELRGAEGRATEC